MINAPRHQKKDELVTASLRALFEARGFTQARVNRFEEYELYADNRNFLRADSVVTFTDLDGRLMALKPDVTLSIVKNVSDKQLRHFEKLFYVDEVCRGSRDSREYKMRRQVGVELIGPTDPFVNLEILDLALECLSTISEEYVLDVSHQGFVSGLLDAAELPFSVRERLLTAFHTKSPHHVGNILDEAGVNGEVKKRFLALTALSGSIADTLPRAKELVASPGMEEAYRELADLAAMLRQSDMADRVNLDFSVVNDLDYYNGLSFLGYVKGVPDVVLTGGRYDNLMRKMGKKSGAIGFAVSLSGLNTSFKSGKTHDFDVLLTYDPGCDCAALLAAAKKLVAEGKSVRLEQAGSDCRLDCPQRLHFGAQGLVPGKEEA
jgi:ATP phosphoribosyltransferase regulatory subunit